MKKEYRPSLDEIEYYLVKRSLELLRGVFHSNLSPIYRDINSIFKVLRPPPYTKKDIAEAGGILACMELRLGDLLERLGKRQRGKRRLLWKRHFGEKDQSPIVEALEKDTLALVVAINKGDDWLIEQISKGKKVDFEGEDVLIRKEKKEGYA